MASRLSVERSDIAAVWSAVAKHRDRAGDTEGAKLARWQSKQYRTAYPKPLRRIGFYQYRIPR
jgi:hypothetical protein